MKVLIAYDGTECSDAAIVDLRRAGLPADIDASVSSVTEISRQAPAVAYSAWVSVPGVVLPNRVESDDPAGHSGEGAEALAVQAADRLAADFPRWHIATEAWMDAAGSAIVRKAHAWKPDLVVVGSHGRSGISRLVLGSVSQYVLHHLTCSVRISRHHLHSQERPIRLLIGMDGSNNATIGVRAVVARNWPASTEVRVVGVLDSQIALAAASTPMGAIPTEIEDESRRSLSLAVHQAEMDLARFGLGATSKVLTGNPAELLLAESQMWAADCVFVGARGLNGLERILLGSVSTAVASRAHCSVEIVRRPLE